MKIHEALREYIESNGIKQSFISESTNIPQSAVSRMLNGNIRLTADSFAMICGAINVQMEVIVEMTRCRS